MKQPSSLFKFAALVSSMLIASGFVAYSAGALGWFKQDRPALTNDGSNLNREMFYGSKSGVLVDRSTAPAAREANAQPTAFFGGSKTISIVPLVPPPVTDAKPVAGEPKQSIVLNHKAEQKEKNFEQGATKSAMN
jgi:hypothetical protein